MYLYSDSTIDEVLQTASCFEQSVDETFQEYFERCDAIENLYFTQLNEIWKSEELQNEAQQLIRNEFKKLEDIRIGLEKNKVYLQGLKNNVTKLEEQRLEKESELKKLEKEVEKEKIKIQSSLDDREDIERKKDIILAYKLITNTSFVYSTKKVTGVVLKNPPKPFSFNPQELSQEEITQKLWQLVLGDK